LPTMKPKRCRFLRSTIKMFKTAQVSCELLCAALDAQQMSSTNHVRTTDLHRPAIDGI